MNEIILEYLVGPNPTTTSVRKFIVNVCILLTDIPNIAKAREDRLTLVIVQSCRSCGGEEIVVGSVLNMVVGT